MRGKPEGERGGRAAGSPLLREAHELPRLNLGAQRLGRKLACLLELPVNVGAKWSSRQGGEGAVLARMPPDPVEDP